MTARGDFWARRKAAVQAEQDADIVLADSQAEQAELAIREARPDAEILAELDLPDPDSLQPGDDVARFMARAVPDRLRRRALRKLWTLNPVLANLDGLVDYGEDFTEVAGMTGKLQTTYQVGKGMLAHLEYLARQAEAPDTTTEVTVADDPVDAPCDDPAIAAPEPVEPAPRETPVTRVADADPTATDETDSPAPAPRRMRFAFEG